MSEPIGQARERIGSRADVPGSRACRSGHQASVSAAEQAYLVDERAACIASDRFSANAHPLGTPTVRIDPRRAPLGSPRAP